MEAKETGASRPAEFGSGQHATSRGGEFPGLEQTLELWTSLMMQPALAAGQAGSHHELPGLPSEGLKQLGQMLTQDSLLRPIDQLLNENPFHKVIPIDWAEIARALRVVWLRSLNDPAHSLASFTELTFEIWRSGLEIWIEAGQRWLGERPSPAEAAKAEADKRFAAPEWHRIRTSARSGKRTGSPPIGFSSRARRTTWTNPNGIGSPFICGSSWMQ